MAEIKTQDQRSLAEQLLELAALADRNGLYDAADCVRRSLSLAVAQVMLDEVRGNGR